MSGGSYNYLCYKDSAELFQHRTELAEMRDRLTALGYLDAAKETESILLILDSFEVRTQARIDRLKKLWQAVEWADSGDWDKEDIEEEIQKYRDIKP
jgi:hypothetical protein